MSNPKKIQRKRTKGWRMPDNAVYVGRPTKYGNPYGMQIDTGLQMDPWHVRRGGEVITKHGTKQAAAEQAVYSFMDYLDAMPTSDREALLADLRGKNLACWCSLDAPCHADVLLKLANAEDDEVAK